ncbi:MAG: chemotaxis protein CheW [Planctomycetes bacterium]|nr:chemotaxis protein CheW [Planctomycetota bacterium]
MSVLRVLDVVAGGQRFAIDIGVVQGIERPRRWARLPFAPPYVLGICEIAGTVVAVVDLAIRLRLPASQGPSAGGVVLLDSAEPIGLAVEEIRGVGELDLSAGIDLGPTGQAAGARGLAADGRILLESEPLVDGRPLTSLREVLGDAWKGAK